MITWSPSFTRKQGDMCAGIFECLFSYLKNTTNQSRTQNKEQNRTSSKGKELIPLVLLHPMQVVPSDNDCSHHLSTMAGSSKDTASDGYITRERAFLVNVCAWTKRNPLLNRKQPDKQYDNKNNQMNKEPIFVFLRIV